MTAPHPQRCSWLCNHYEFVSPNTDCGGWVKCKLSGMELTMQQFLQMEVTGCASHTHTPAPATPEETTQQAWERGFDDGKTACLVDLNLLEQVARKDEREKVLDEVIAAIEHQKDHKEFLLSRDTKDIVEDIVDSLRGGATQQGGSER